MRRKPGLLMALPESHIARIVPLEAAKAVIPSDILRRLVTFLVDKRTGNVSLNIRDGVILGARVEEIVSAKGRTARN